MALKNLKKLKEDRLSFYDKMNEIINKADGETRAMTEDEEKEFDELEKKIQAIDKTIESEERSRKYAPAANNPANEPEDNSEEQRAQNDEKLLTEYIRGTVSENRADINLTYTDNGAVIPSTIADKIIEEVKDISPILTMAETYTVTGDLTIPYYDDNTGDVTMAYSDDFTELESDNGKFGNITLTGFLAGSLSKIGRKLLNSSKFPLVNFITRKMSQNIADFMERELLIGTAGKISGLSGITNIVTTGSAIAVTGDDLIDLQEEVIDRYQPNAVWIMKRTTRKAIRKLKDADGDYLLNRDLSAKWGYTLLGKDVYTSDNMPDLAAGAKAIYYGDFNGLAVKISEEISIEVLREKYVTQHAIGIVGWVDFDAQVQNNQMLACLQMAAS